MACGSFVFWTPVLGGSVIKMKASGGEQGAFIVVAKVGRNGVAQNPPLTHEQIIAGVEIPVNDGDVIGLNPTIILFDDVDDPVTLTVQVEDGAGNIIDVSDGAGGTRPASCEWQIEMESHSPMPIKILMGP